MPQHLPGGDTFSLPWSTTTPPQTTLLNSFFPGPDNNPLFDGPWAEPSTIIDFAGAVAQVYMGGTAFDANGKKYFVEVDERAYQGVYIGTDGRVAYGTFCEIWFDLYDASSASTQLHDFSPGNGEHDGIDANANARFGDLFWTIRLNDTQFRISEDGKTASLDVEDQLEFDRILFLGNADIPMKLSFHIDYTRDDGPPHPVKPLGGAYGPSQWRGVMWNAHATGRFSAAYLDGSASWSGKINSAGAPDQTVLNGIALPFGHMGYEANGKFAQHGP